MRATRRLPEPEKVALIARVQNELEAL